jgi:hypothetical protein
VVLIRLRSWLTIAARAPREAWRVTMLGMLAATMALGEESPAPQVLAFHGGLQPAVIHALVAITAGEVEMVKQLPLSLFHAGYAVVDPTTGDLSRRWSQCIPLALARTPAEFRPAILAILDQDCRQDLLQHPERPWLAIDYLPCASAQAALAHLADAAFDRGDFPGSLSADTLAGLQDPLRSARDLVARGLGGDDAVVDAALELTAPGEPVASAPSAGPARSGESVVWKSQPGWLLACTPQDQVLWQFRLDLGAEVLTGAGAALVHDGLGLREISETGAVTALTPPPGNTRLLAVSGGASWYATGSRVWRLPLGTDRARSLDLGQEPLCAPLVRGARSLWLLPQELVLCDGSAVIARMRHHLGVSAAWRLASRRAGAEDTVLVVSPDGGAWSIPPLGAQLAGADTIGRARLLVQASRPAEALSLLGSSLLAQDAQARAVALRAHLALGPAHVAAEHDAIIALASSDEEVASILYARFLLSPPADAANASALLLSQLRQHPQNLVSWSLDELGVDPERWRHASSAGILADAIERWQVRHAATAPPDPHHPLLPGEPQSAAVVADEVVLDPRLGRAHRCGDGVVALEHISGETLLTCLDAQSHRLRWRTRWSTDPLVPSRSLSICDGYCLVAEGTSRLVALDGRSGEIRMVVDCAGIPAQNSHVRIISDHCLMMTSPLNDELLIARAVPATAFAAPSLQLDGTRLLLPRPARWLAPLPELDQGLVLFDDGSAARYPVDGGDPAGAPTVLPAALAATAEAPGLSSQGLLSGGVLYRWNQ